MEVNKQKDYEIEFFSLFKHKQKISEMNFIAKIEEINSETEQMSLTISSLEKNKKFYKGLYTIKGEIFPIPKINDIIQIEEVEFKFDENFNPGFFIRISKTKDLNSIVLQDKRSILDLSKDNIIKTLTDVFNIREKLYSKAFIIIDDSLNDYYILKCMENNLNFYLTKQSTFLDYIFHKNDLIYICNCYEYKDNNGYNIGLTLITLVAKLTEENLFFLLEKNLYNQSQYVLGKVVEIINYNNQKEIILLGENKNLFKLINKDDNIKLGQICLFTNYVLSENKNSMPIIEETNQSFYYASSQEIYFFNKIKLNRLSVMQFHFLDFISKKSNLYNAIKINEDKIDIISKQMNIIIENKRIKNYEFYPISIQLISEENEENSKNIIFQFNLLHGLLNKINAFINIKPKIPYFYEYLYYYFDSTIYQAKKNIYLDNKLYCILIYDIFDSSYRLRFNILNIPFQNECEEKLLEKSNSLMVCEVFSERSLIPKTIGIFSINEMKNNIPELKSNNIFDKYYNDFGFIYNSLSDFKNQNENDFIDICKEKFKDKIILDKSLEFKNINCYEEEISLSQFKTRIGIIVSYYLNISSENEKIDCFSKTQNIFSSIYRHKNNLTLIQFLRLFKFLINKLLIDYKMYKICFISELDEFSPFLIAYNFNVDEINKINESSKLFMAYLQIDSNILINRFLNNTKSYSLSIEPLFIIKNHLLQTYEGFFLIEKSDQYQKDITDEKITIINIKKIFKFSDIIKFKENDKNIRPDILKNHAFTISMEFMNENNLNHKKNLKNRINSSPIYYFDKANIKKIEGQNSELIEAFINEDRNIISSLKTDLIYGELLDTKFFIQKDFNELHKMIEDIQKKNNKFNNRINRRKILKNKINGDFNTKEKEFEAAFLEMKKTGTIMISDEEYTDYLIKEIIKTSKNNNTYEQLPEIILYIDKRLEEEKKENK